MRVTVTVSGAALGVLNHRKRTVDLLLLNTSDRISPTGKRLYHHPLLIARRKDLSDPVHGPVASLEGLLQEDTKVCKQLVGWHLSGRALALRGKASTGIKLFEEKQWSGTHPESAEGPWDDWRWITNLSRIAPGCRVKPAYRSVGPETLGIVHLRDGQLRATKPRDGQGARYVWSFSSKLQQAVTDQYAFEFDVDALQLQVGDSKILFKQKGRIDLRIVHEAPPGEMVMERASRTPNQGASPSPGESTLPENLAKGGRTPDIRIQHFPVYYEAIDGAVLPPEPPKATWQYDGHELQDTPYCNPTLIEE